MSTIITINANDTAAIRRDEDVVTAFNKIGSTSSPYDQWYYRGLLNFSLASIPKGAKILSAKIDCYLSSNLGSESGSYSAHTVSQSWSGAYVTRYYRTSSETWSTIGGSFEATASGDSGVLSASESFGWKSWTLNWNGLSNLQAMIRGTKSNYGWLLKNSENANRAHGFDRTGNIPRLVIEYQVDMPRAVTMFF